MRQQVKSKILSTFAPVTSLCLLLGCHTIHFRQKLKRKPHSTNFRRHKFRKPGLNIDTIHKLFRSWPFSRDMSNLLFTSAEGYLTIILRLTSVILDHMQKRRKMEVNRKSAWNGINLGLASDQGELKSQVSSSRNFLAVLVFNVSVDVVRMFLSCSVIMVFL